jgi:hypothetical protein
MHSLWQLNLRTRKSPAATASARHIPTRCTIGWSPWPLATSAYSIWDVVPVNLREPWLAGSRRWTLLILQGPCWRRASASMPDATPTFGGLRTGLKRRRSPVPTIHWMRHELVMPKLAGALKSGAPLALVSGDGPAEADWLDAYRAVITRWIERNGRRWGDETHRALMTAHAPWLDEEGSETFQTEVRQSVDDLIAGEHSRATWARARMGPIAAELFDNELREALEPAALNGEVSYVARVTLTWGRPLASPMPRSDRIR